MRTCSVDGCGGKHLAKGFCRAHYLRVYKHGSLEKLTMRGESVIARIMAKVQILPNGCWVFTGCITENGYGHIRLEGRMRHTHAVTYEDKYGPIPDGLEPDHFYCDNKVCCNPDHVKPVTHQENVARAVAQSPAWGVAALPPAERHERAKRAAAARWHPAKEKELI
jgi:hypothetical protein